jgi:hypothetical protein
MRPLSIAIRATDHPAHARLVDVLRPLIAQGYRLRQTRRGLLAIRERRP